MHRLLTIAGAAALLLTGFHPVHAETSAATAALDDFWSEVARTVAEGDFAGYAATYHADAVLVSKSRQASLPIAKALDGWQQGFMDTKAEKTKSKVEFRFTHRLNDQATAHETGIFHYTSRPVQGEAVDSYIHFEALLINKNGWKMIMEYQKEPATETEWIAAD